MLQAHCLCTPNPKGELCKLIRLLLTIKVDVTNVGTIGSSRATHLKGTGEDFYISFGDAGYSEVDLAIGRFGPIWDSLYLLQYMDASLFQVPSPPGSQYEMSTVEVHIIQSYRCTNLVDGSIRDMPPIDSVPAAGGESRCEYGGETRGKVISFTGGFSTYFYKSTPLGQCLSGAVNQTSGGFFPPPDLSQSITYDGIGDNCICATGGSGDYEFSIVGGNLPSGVELDRDTGCFHGEPDGAIPGTYEITYQVIDRGGAGNSTSFYEVGGVCNIGGSGGKTVTLVSGLPFDSGGWVAGDRIIFAVPNAFDGSDIFHERYIVTITSGTVLTMDEVVNGTNIPGGASGQWANVGWTMRIYVPTGDPTPPQTATVVCGYLPGPCVTSAPSGNFFL